MNYYINSNTLIVLKHKYNMQWKTNSHTCIIKTLKRFTKLISRHTYSGPLKLNWKANQFSYHHSFLQSFPLYSQINITLLKIQSYLICYNQDHRSDRLVTPDVELSRSLIINFNFKENCISYGRAINVILNFWENSSLKPYLRF